MFAKREYPGSRTAVGIVVTDKCWVLRCLRVPQAFPDGTLSFNDEDENSPSSAGEGAVAH